MARKGICRICGRRFLDKRRGPLSGACPEHRDEYRARLSRRRLERWAAKRLEEILRQAIEEPA